MTTKPNVYKAILGQLTSSQRWNITITRLFYGVLAANLMIHTVLFMYVLPILVLPMAAWAAVKKGEEWHGGLFPNGYRERNRSSLKLIYRNAAITGLGFSIFLGFMDYFASFFATYFITVVGICFLTTFFFTKGMVGGWTLVVDPAAAPMELEELSSVDLPNKVQQVTSWNAIFACLAIALVYNIVSYKSTIDAADAVRDSHQAAQESSSETDSLASAMSGGSSDVQTPDQSNQAPQEQPPPTPVKAEAVTAPKQDDMMTAPTAPVTADTTAGYPTDDADAIGAMQELARQGVMADPKDPMVDHATGQLTTGTFPLWAGKPRSDGYPAYAVMCAMAKDTCTQLNGMGQYLDSPIESLGTALTVMRNSDVTSGRYTCGHGICTDAKMNLVGRISQAMLKDHPELAR